MTYRGFTLVEMAIVLIVIGLIMMTILPALTTLRASTQRSVTQANLKALMTATAAYVQAYGCLPCPTPATIANTSLAGFGRVGGNASATATCVSCAASDGIPPFVSLGIPESTAHDGWMHWITMRVDPALTLNPQNIMPPTSPCLATDVGVTQSCTIQGYSQKGLCRGNISKAQSIQVQIANQTSTPAIDSAAVIFVSHGRSGLGSFFALPTANARNGNRVLPSPSCSSIGGYANCNARNNGTFIDAPMIEGGGDPYDDILAYADRNSLVSAFGNVSCQTPW